VTGARNVQKPSEALSGSTSTRSDVDHVSVRSCDTNSQLSTHLAPVNLGDRPIAEVMKGFGVVERSWGSSNDWFLDLRDGRQLCVPVDLSAPVAKSPQEEEIAQKLLQWVTAK
jgi:hypothetical protein